MTSPGELTSSMIEPSSMTVGRLSGGRLFDAREAASDWSPPTPRMCVGVDLPLTSVDAGEAARFLHALLYAHAIAVHRTHPRPSAVAPTITAVESGDSAAPTASPTSAKAMGGAGVGARGDTSGGEGSPSSVA